VAVIVGRDVSLAMIDMAVSPQHQFLQDEKQHDAEQDGGRSIFDTLGQLESVRQYFQECRPEQGANGIADQHRHPGRAQHQRERGRARWPWVVGGAVAFLLAAILAAYVSKNGLPGLGAADEDSTESEAAPPSTVSEPGTQAPASRADAPVQQQSPATDATAGSTGSAAAGGVEAPRPFASAGTPPAAAPPAPGQVSLQLRFATDSWVEIFDGSGKAVLYDLGKAGSERTVTATAPLSVTLGNAPGVAIAVNGRVLPPPPRVDGAMARFSVGADGQIR